MAQEFVVEPVEDGDSMLFWEDLLEEGPEIATDSMPGA